MKITIEADGIVLTDFMSPDQEKTVSDFIRFCDGKVTAADVLIVAVEVGLEMYEKVMKKPQESQLPGIKVTTKNISPLLYVENRRKSRCRI